MHTQKMQRCMGRGAYNAGENITACGGGGIGGGVRSVFCVEKHAVVPPH